MQKVTLIAGDGICPDVTASARDIVPARGAAIESRKLLRACVQTNVQVYRWWQLCSIPLRATNHDHGARPFGGGAGATLMTVIVHKLNEQ